MRRIPLVQNDSLEHCFLQETYLGPDKASESSQSEIVTDENWAGTEVAALSSVPKRRTLCEPKVFLSQPREVVEPRLNVHTTTLRAEIESLREVQCSSEGKRQK